MDNPIFGAIVSIVLHTVIAETDTVTRYMKSDGAKDSRMIWSGDKQAKSQMCLEKYSIFWGITESEFNQYL